VRSVDEIVRERLVHFLFAEIVIFFGDATVLVAAQVAQEAVER
jgi:hypothetical protein